MGIADVLLGQPKERWQVIETDSEVHVTPIYGTIHELSKVCWCFPKWEEYKRDLVIHNEPN